MLLLAKGCSPGAQSLHSCGMGWTFRLLKIYACLCLLDFQVVAYLVGLQLLDVVHIQLDNLLKDAVAGLQLSLLLHQAAHLLSQLLQLFLRVPHLLLQTQVHSASVLAQNLVHKPAAMQTGFMLPQDCSFLVIVPDVAFIALASLVSAVSWPLNCNTLGHFDTLHYVLFTSTFTVRTGARVQAVIEAYLLALPKSLLRIPAPKQARCEEGRIRQKKQTP